MTALPADQRRQLEKTVREAWRVAVLAAQAALARLGVGEPKAPTYLSADEQALRRRLRAHARYLGDGLLAGGGHETRRLSQEVAYEHWHRMLFARYLAENHLLMHPEHGVAVSLDECAAFAKEAGHEDTWLIAASFATKMLPAIFRPDDAALAVALAPEYRSQLEGLVLGLTPSTFTASDSLGWVYQFWQADEKDRVNDSEVKIGADELPVVTQLFTEPYMVQFLLHNSLGAWWAAKRLTPAQLASAASEQELRDTVALPGYAFTYLRFVREGEAEPWQPAAGTFAEWPRTLQSFSSLDPCCGSGHFLVELLNLMARLRMADEGLSAKTAVDAVLRENLHGLEIDPRCTQIAVFAVALTAWGFPNAGGFRTLPPILIACCGLRPAGSREEWMALSDRIVGDSQRNRLRAGLERVWRVFQDAPILGTLLDPGSVDAQSNLFSAGWAEVQPLVQQSLMDRQLFDTDERSEIGVVANGLTEAACLLTKSYELILTNVPYLGRSKQSEKLKTFCEDKYPHSKADLATCFIERCIELLGTGGLTGIVSQQNWWFLASYKKMRLGLLKNTRITGLVTLGEEAWQAFGDRGPLATLALMHNSLPRLSAQHFAIDALSQKTIGEKIAMLGNGAIAVHLQSDLRSAPDSRFGVSAASNGKLLSETASSNNGIVTGDYPRFGRNFSEFPQKPESFIFQQGSVSSPMYYGGMESVILWDGQNGRFFSYLNDRLEGNIGAWIRGLDAWGKPGVLVCGMRTLYSSIYVGGAFDNNTTALSLIINTANVHRAIWTYCFHGDYIKQVRKLNQKVSVTDDSFVKVPFDEIKWDNLGAELYPHGLPNPYTNDPTQWIFHGHPCGSVIWNEQSKRTDNGPTRRDATVLQVALARLLCYRWPAEYDEAMDLADEQRAWVRCCAYLQPMADDDGIVCLPSVRGEAPAADRLRAMVAASYGAEWSAGVLSDLLTACGHPGMTLDNWLRDHAFQEHCTLFQQRPFLWHIWDGAKDGFSAFVNYHRLDRRGLENLTYTYLGDWIAAQKRDATAKVPGADLRRAAAEALQARLVQIVEGEKPFDIFVRWKPLHEQPLGWDPDLDDGVRLNIRPFITAEVLRWEPKIKYAKDRGHDPESAPWFARFKGERINDHHTTLAEKQAARAQAGARKGRS